MASVNLKSALTKARKHIQDNPDRYPCSAEEIDAMLVVDPQSKGGASRYRIFDRTTYTTILTINSETGEIVLTNA